ncbi:hypothetical protein LF95_04115 [Thalassospira sp. TSL5-1]|nr:hypothetical protein LF95_04115 [Thalassospira sp. TSL5-1]
MFSAIPAAKMFFGMGQTTRDRDLKSAHIDADAKYPPRITALDFAHVNKMPVGIVMRACS